MDRFSTSFSSKSTYFSSIWPRHGAIRAAFGTIQAVTSCGPLRTVEQSPRKRESGSFHENRPAFGNPGVATTGSVRTPSAHEPHVCLRAAKMLAKGTLDRGPTGVHAAQMRLDPEFL